MPKPYPDYQMSSGWNALLPNREPSPPLAETLDADVVIVGAGFTGIACARRWHEHSPDARIVLIDASEIGEGNPGRNSGFLLEIALAEDADPKNASRMASCNELTQQAMQSLVRDVEAAEQSIDFERAGTYRAAVGDVGLQSLNNYRQFLQAAGLPHRELDREQLQQELGTDYYQAGLYSPHCYLVQPAALIRVLASLLPAAVSVYENTPALEITKEQGGWHVQTSKGMLRCRNLVLANNSYARDLGAARSRLAAVYTYAGLTPQLPESVLQALGSNTNWGLLPTHPMGSTLRRTADGRLLVRSLHDYEREGNPAVIASALQERLVNRFPQVAGIELEQVWGGAVGITYNGAPVWGEPEPGLFASCGCNGGGTVKGTLLGSLLADLAHGEPVPDVAGLFGSASWMPPEPLRAIGFYCSSKWQSWRGRLEL